MSQPAQSITILLVHGAFTSSSSWAKVASRLVANGFAVEAVDLSLRSLSEDIEIVSQAIEGLNGPIFLVGHSYGGAVISGAGLHPQVKGLGFVAAFPLDKEESLQGLTSQGEPSPVAAAIRMDDHGFLSLTEEGFLQFFASGLTSADARALLALQQPIAGAAWGEPLSVSAAWHEKPSWYALAQEDQVLPSPVQEYFTQRVQAKSVLRLPSGHAMMASHPEDLAQFLTEAAESIAGESR